MADDVMKHFLHLIPKSLLLELILVVKFLQIYENSSDRSFILSGRAIITYIVANEFNLGDRVYKAGG